MKSRIGKVLTGILIILIVLLIVFIALPSPVDALAWQPPAAPAATGNLAPNSELRKGALHLESEIARPEDVVLDKEGRVLTGSADGKIYRVTFDVAGKPASEVFATTGGTLLDLNFGIDGRLLVAVWDVGIVAIAPDGTPTTLVKEGTLVNGRPFRRGDGVVQVSDGTIYYTSGSERPLYDDFLMALEARSWGRLLAFDPATGENREVYADLSFANGIATAPDESFLLVADQMRYRLMRHWLRGEKAGQTDLFVENLPGFPHNIHYDSDGMLWVALNTGRNQLLDTVNPHPFLKNQIAKLPKQFFLTPAIRPENVRGTASVVVLDREGKITRSLQNQPSQWTSVSGARRHGNTLYIVALGGNGIMAYSL
jgi:sugar lactone lactonase YvrE